VIRFLRLYNVRGQRMTGASGVWVKLGETTAADESGGAADLSRASNPTPASTAALHKIAALGLSCSGWVSMHGCALNLDCDLTPFEHIVPCGLEDADKYAGVTSLKQVLEQQRPRLSKGPVILDHAKIRAQILQCFRDEFGLPAPIAIRTQTPHANT